MTQTRMLWHQDRDKWKDKPFTVVLADRPRQSTGYLKKNGSHLKAVSAQSNEDNLMINFASRTTESVLNSDVSQSKCNAGFWHKDGVDENYKWSLNVKPIPNSLGFGELSCYEGLSITSQCRVPRTFSELDWQRRPIALACCPVDDLFPLSKAAVAPASPLNGCWPWLLQFFELTVSLSQLVFAN